MECASRVNPFIIRHTISLLCLILCVMHVNKKQDMASSTAVLRLQRACPAFLAHEFKTQVKCRLWPADQGGVKKTPKHSDSLLEKFRVQGLKREIEKSILCNGSSFTQFMYCWEGRKWKGKTYKWQKRRIATTNFSQHAICLCGLLVLLKSHLLAAMLGSQYVWRVPD